MEFMKDFPERLKKGMKAQKLTVTRLANDLGVSRATVYNWLKGTIPEWPTLEALAKRLKTDVATLTYGTSPSPINEAYLEAVIERVEVFLADEGISLSPKKKGVLIVTLLRMTNTAGSVPDQEVIAALIRMSMI